MPVKKKASRKKIAKKKVIRKRVAKKVSKKPVLRKKGAVKKVKEAVIGTVTHYFPKVRAAVVKLKTPLALGDAVKIKGHTTDFTQTVTSMQIDLVPITVGEKGQEIGLLVESRVRQHDKVYKA